MGHSPVGIYFGVDFIDLVILGGSKEKPRVIKSARAPIYAEPSDAGHKDKMALFPPAIKKAFEMSGIKEKAVNFGLPQDEVIVRRFRMPYLPDAERLNAVRFEAQKYLPFKLDNTISDFCVTKEFKPQKSMDVLFVAANKQVMTKYENLFKESKIGLKIIDTISIALLRILSVCNKIKEGKTTVVVYAEKNSRGSIIIIKEGNIYLVRELGTLTSKDTFLENILNNIRVSIDYYKRETKEVGVDNILICGDIGLKELEMYLRENILSTQIETFSLKDQIDGLSEISKKQMVAIGLAMASLEKPSPRINLVASEPKGAVAKGLMQYKPLVIEGVACFLVLVLLQVFMSANLERHQRKKAQLKAKRMTIASVVSPDVSHVQLSAIEDENKLKLEFFKNFVTENRLFLTKKLNSLGRLLPKDGWIKTFQFTDELNKARRLDIKGIIYSQDKNEAILANKMLVDMKALRDFYFGFKDIKLSSLRREAFYTQEVLAFSVDCVGQPLDSSGVLTDSKKKR